MEMDRKALDKRPVTYCGQRWWHGLVLMLSQRSQGQFLEEPYQWLRVYGPWAFQIFVPNIIKF